MGYWWVPRLVLIQSWVDDIVRGRGLSVSPSISFQTGLIADCADLGLTRTPERMELLYPRSKLVTTAKAFGLQAIDLVRLSPSPLTKH